MVGRVGPLALMIPPEIATFLSTPGRVLLVKGAAGTGKTLFAVAVARAYQFHGGDVIWMASRHADPREALELEQVIPASHRRDLTAGAVADARDAPAGAAYAEAAERRPGAVLEDLAAEVQGSEDPLVIIDSIDGLFADESQAQVARFLTGAVALARARGARLLLVAESDQPHAIDHLVDGVVVLQRHLTDGEVERHILLQKLRGTAVNHPAYLFTLRDGRFSAFVHPQPEPVRPLRPPARAGPDGGLSTTVVAWDRLLDGGLALGSVLLLEIDSEVGPEHVSLTRPLLINALNLRWSVVYAGGPNEPIGRLRRSLADHTDPADLEQHLHLFSEVGSSADAPPPQERLAPLERIRRQARAHGPVLTVLHGDGLAAATGDVPVAHNWLARWCHQTRDAPDIDVLLAPQGTGAALAPLADSWWRLQRRLDAIVLQGVRPRTELYLVHRREHKGYPEALLEPIQ